MEQPNREILADIEALLREYEAGTTDAVRNMEPEPQRIAATPTPARPPKVGTVIQRSDHTNRRKQEAFLAPPPPPPKARAQRPYERPPRPISQAAATTERPTLLRPMGPQQPPPIPIEMEPGVIVEVPHFAVYVSRRYKPRTATGRWILRFTRNGKVRYCRQLQ
ncbi:Ubiquitin carboxyl-terminal hydrolase [Camponotus japonicus]